MRELHEWISDSIDSVEQLEILLLLQGNPSRSWNISELSVHLRSHRESVSLRIQGLLTKGFVSCLQAEGRPTSFQYSPPSPQVDEKIRILKDAYINKRITVINMIYEKIDRSVIEDFADAFKFTPADKESAAKKKGTRWQL
jgi:hypothetical protein